MKLNNATIASMIRKTFGINITSINENGRLAYWFDKDKKEEAIEKLLNVLCYLIEDGHDKKENIRERMEIVEDGNFGKIYFQLM